MVKIVPRRVTFNGRDSGAGELGKIVPKVREGFTQPIAVGVDRVVGGEVDGCVVASSFLQRNDGEEGCCREDAVVAVLPVEVSVVQAIDSCREVLLKLVVGRVVGLVDPLDCVALVLATNMKVGSESSALTLFPEVDTLIEGKIVLAQLIVLKHVEGVESCQTGHDVLPDVLTKGYHSQTSFDS